MEATLERPAFGEEEIIPEIPEQSTPEVADEAAPAGCQLGRFATGACVNVSCAIFEMCQAGAATNTAEESPGSEVDKRTPREQLFDETVDKVVANSPSTAQKAGKPLATKPPAKPEKLPAPSEATPSGPPKSEQTAAPAKQPPEPESIKIPEQKPASKLPEPQTPDLPVPRPAERKQDNHTTTKQPIRETPDDRTATEHPRTTMRPSVSKSTEAPPQKPQTAPEQQPPKQKTEPLVEARTADVQPELRPLVTPDFVAAAEPAPQPSVKEAAVASEAPQSTEKPETSSHVATEQAVAPKRVSDSKPDQQPIIVAQPVAESVAASNQHSEEITVDVSTEKSMPQKSSVQPEVENEALATASSPPVVTVVEQLPPRLIQAEEQIAVEEPADSTPKLILEPEVPSYDDTGPEVYAFANQAEQAVDIIPDLGSEVPMHFEPVDETDVNTYRDIIVPISDDEMTIADWPQVEFEQPEADLQPLQQFETRGDEPITAPVVDETSMIINTAEPLDTEEVEPQLAVEPSESMPAEHTINQMAEEPTEPTEPNLEYNAEYGPEPVVIEQAEDLTLAILPEETIEVCTENQPEQPVLPPEPTANVDDEPIAPETSNNPEVSFLQELASSEETELAEIDSEASEVEAPQPEQQTEPIEHDFIAMAASDRDENDDSYSVENLTNPEQARHSHGQTSIDRLIEALLGERACALV